jgi:hypothetical protein
MKDMSPIVATRGNIQAVGDDDNNPAPAISSEGALVSSQGDIQSRIDLQPQFPGMLTRATNTNANTMDSSKPMSGIYISQLDNVSTDKDWVQSGSELVYNEEGDYYVDRLQHMWIHEDPSSFIDPLEDHRWCLFEEKYFKRIEVQELLLRQASKSTVMVKDDAVEGATSDSVPNTPSAGNMRDIMERVLETPPE